MELWFIRQKKKISPTSTTPGRFLRAAASTNIGSAEALPIVRSVRSVRE